ncbi:MAG: NAD-dependent epimerase/dehydratase family protein [Bacteroidota bacterium]
MQTILGAGGAIGQQLAKELTSYTSDIRLVARHPKRVNPTDELFSADLLDQEQTLKAVADSEIVYLTVGLPYTAKIWERDWPRLMDNVLAACEVSGAKLVFFDNIYMYDPSQIGQMDESTPIAPSSRKGKVRQLIAEKVLNAHREGKVQTLIARSADFYGPGIRNSVFNELVVKNVAVGKRPQWFCSGDMPHNFTYTPDAAKATAQLGNDASAFGRVWHLPTHQDIITGKEWCKLTAEAFGVASKSPILIKPWLLRILGLFVPAMGSTVEMLYQYDRPYTFRSDAFTERYGWKATPVKVALGEIVSAAKGGVN